MTATPTRSSAAPGDGSVESEWALTRIALAFEEGVPSERRTMTLLVGGKEEESQPEFERRRGGSKAYLEMPKYLQKREESVWG
jgi:hypothetical protein